MANPSALALPFSPTPIRNRKWRGSVKSFPKGSSSGNIWSRKSLEELLRNLDAIHSPLHFQAYASLLKFCVQKKAWAEGKQVHRHMKETGFEPNTYVANMLLNLYAKSGSLGDARQVLDEMREADVGSWTAIIVASLSHGLPRHALALFPQMLQTHVHPNHFTFSALLCACTKLAALEDGLHVHREVVKSGYDSHLYVGNALLDMYAKCGRLDNARHVFDRMPHRDVVSWNAMMGGYVHSCLVEEATKLFERMPRRNLVSWNSMIAAYVQNGELCRALGLFEKMPERDVVSWSAITRGYAQSGRMDEALALFRNTPHPNCVAWTVMIAGFTHNGRCLEALEFFQEMQTAGVLADANAFASVLRACASLGALQRGTRIHGQIVTSGLHNDVAVATALVDMYAKCGSLERARNVFDEMPVRNIASWTAIIGGYARHGHAQQALHLFEQMPFAPNHVTFLSVLYTCCHAGLVDQGRHYFYLMTQYYRMPPAMKHCVCMVDLFGRAGLFDEALDFISKMPLKPGVDVWVCLLGACRIHNNIELAQTAAKRLLDLEPQSAGPYVLLSNSYAAAGRWDDADNMRKIMKGKGFKKIGGSSWIEVNGRIHSFFVGDRSHPEIEKIYAKLENLWKQMKEAGYVPDTRFALYDIEEHEKEQVLCYHSEKLAIAFGLTKTAAGEPIRIMKNLRICGDCHSATKLISKICAREIIVRDANRYHHFKDGGCSCRDFW